MQYPPTPRIPTVPLPAVGAYAYYHSDAPVLVLPGSNANANDPPPTVHAVLSDGVLCDASPSPATRGAFGRFTHPDGRPLARAVLAAPAALPADLPCAVVSFSAVTIAGNVNATANLPPRIFVRSSGAFVSVRDVLDAVDTALQRRAQLGLAGGVRWVRVHVRCLSSGDFRVQLVPDGAS